MKRLISLLVSLGILALLYWKIDVGKLLAVFADCDRLWLVISLGMVIPITLVTAWRLQQLLPTPSPRSVGSARAEQTGLGFGEANRLILAASVLNMVLPSKMGDIAKAYFMKDRGHLDGSLALSLVVFEKACDMLSLLLWCVFGLVIYAQQAGARTPLFGIMGVSIALCLGMGLLLLGSASFAQTFFKLGQRLAPPKLKPKFERLGQSWGEMHRYFWRDRRRLLVITLTSIALWFLHLLQIWLFILALKAWTPFVTSLALSPLAILAGLLPLTFAGVGTRDAALVWFYQPYFSAPIAAALGVLCTSRYLLPALGGLPFLNQYLGLVRQRNLEKN